MNKLKTIKKLAILPTYLKDYQLELTPVDLCADAIVKLAIYKTKDYNVNVFHLYNDNYVSMNVIVDILNENDIKVKYVQNDEFEKSIASSISNSNDSLGFVEQFDVKNLLTSDKIIFSNSKTVNILSSLEFKWQSITKDYLKFIIRGL